MHETHKCAAVYSHVYCIITCQCGDKVVRPLSCAIREPSSTTVTPIPPPRCNNLLLNIPYRDLRSEVAAWRLFHPGILCRLVIPYSGPTLQLCRTLTFPGEVVMFNVCCVYCKFLARGVEVRCAWRSIRCINHSSYASIIPPKMRKGVQVLPRV